MATDYGKIVEDLLAFYDFRDKTVVAVGAGGGQLIEYGRPARKVIAVDSDPGALEKLRENLRAAGLESKFDPVLCDFNRAEMTGDAVLKVRMSWRAVEDYPIRKRQSFRAIHAFKSYEELFLKVKSQGETSLRRIEKFRNETDISIPMIYEMALI